MSADLLDLLDELAAQTEPGPAVTEIVHQGDSTGHIVVWTDAPARRGGGREYVAFLDMGPVLHLWPGTPVDLTPTDARTLAGMLTTWANRTEN